MNEKNVENEHPKGGEAVLMFAEYAELKCLACQLYYRVRIRDEHSAATSCPYCGYKSDKYIAYVVRWRFHKKLPNSPMANPIVKGHRGPGDDIRHPWVGLSDAELDAYKV